MSWKGGRGERGRASLAHLRSRPRFVLENRTGLRLHRSKLKDELAGAIRPGTTGPIVLAEDTAVAEIEKALAKEVDREAEAAREAVATR